ncbi:MAG: NUDIX domain-containing protein [Blastocatellia bacterium]
MMHSSQLSIPVFGAPNPAQKDTRRVAAYVVVTDNAGRIAAVQGKAGYFLPGGGALPGETPEQTIRREVLEELAREVRLLYCIGEAVQHFEADGRHYRMEAIFYAAEFSSEPDGTGEHELCWIEPAEVERAFYHQCHARAAGRVTGNATD